MKEIVDRLKETRNLELAKSILESKGYKISRLNEESKDKSGNINKVLAYMDSLGISIEDIAGYKKPYIGRFKEFSSNDYMGYQGASDLPNGLKPLLYGSKLFDIVISGDEDDDNTYVVSVIQENVESYKLYDNFDRLINDIDPLIDTLESTDNIDDVLIRNGFKAI